MARTLPARGTVTIHKQRSATEWTSRMEVRPLFVRATLLLAIVTACFPGRVDEMSLAGGSPMAVLALPDDTTAVLVLDPAECTSCDLGVRAWLRGRRMLPSQIRLVLTREPTDPERRQLVLARIAVDGVLRRPWPINGPVVVLWTPDDRPLVRPLPQAAHLLSGLIRSRAPMRDMPDTRREDSNVLDVVK